MLLELETPQFTANQPPHVTEALRYFQEAHKNYLLMSGDQQSNVYVNRSPHS